MEIEAKLDEDFLFYLGFVKIASEKLKSNRNFNDCQIWLQKLCGEIWSGVEAKRNRNIFLSNLVLCMEEQHLSEPFLTAPPAGDLPNAGEIFGLQGSEIKEPAWMADALKGAGDDDASQTVSGGRTYLATKALPDGKGALGYIAISLEDEFPNVVKAGGLDEHFEKKYDELVPPITQMERIMINRRNPEERQRIIGFYQTVLNNVGKEINGSVPLGSNDQVSRLLDQLVRNLRAKGDYDRFEHLPEEKRHLDLLNKLDAQLRQRVKHVKTRESFLDDIENKTMQPSFWDNSMLTEDVYKEDKRAHAMKMWEQALTAGPKAKFMDLIVDKYPPFVIKRFLELLANVKENIALRIQRRHENVVSQLKKELRKEGMKGKKHFDDAKYTSEEMCAVLAAVKAAEQKAYLSQQKRENQLYGHRKERDEMYEQVRRTMQETQQHVEEEAAIGKLLSDQINTLNLQSEIYQNVNEEGILKIENENMNLMKNIQRLNKAVQHHETRILTMKQLLKDKSTLDKGSEFFYM